MSWILIAAVLLLVVIFFVRFKSIRHALGSYLLIAFIVFLVASIYYVYSSQHVDVSSFSGLVKGVKVYFSWIGSAFKNIGQISSYAVKQDWNVNATKIVEAK